MAHVQGDGGGSDDGVGGVAHSSAKTGVFGFNDASNPSPAGIPGGNGVFVFPTCRMPVASSA